MLDMNQSIALLLSFFTFLLGVSIEFQRRGIIMVALCIVPFVVWGTVKTLRGGVSSDSFCLNTLPFNLLPAVSPITNTNGWANLGVWDSAHIQCHAQACEALAVKLADAVNLSPEDQVLDVGMGRGDQCLLWCQHYKVKQVLGIDICAEHLRNARRLLERSFYSQKRIQLIECSATLMDEIPRPLLQDITVVLSLDSAYHYYTREIFFQKARAYSLKPGGRIGLVDFVLDNEAIAMPWTWSWLSQKILARLTGIPHCNMYTQDVYRHKLIQSGFTDIKIETLDDEIFGFSDFVKRHLRMYNVFDSSLIRKFVITAQVLKWVRQHNLIHFVLVTAVASELDLVGAMPTD